ncbi:hypothetical protein J6590_027914 [Homalodisca vitripennis]|nr:hypothetical protein J6590_027914 [Homalodisca vitripennis]
MYGGGLSPCDRNQYGFPSAVLCTRRPLAPTASLRLCMGFVNLHLQYKIAQRENVSLDNGEQTVIKSDLTASSPKRPISKSMFVLGPQLPLCYTVRKKIRIVQELISLIKDE